MTRAPGNVAAVVLAAVLTVAGCSSDDGSGPVTSSAPETTPASTSPPVGDVESSTVPTTSTTSSTVVEVPRTVEITVRSPGLGIDATVAGDAQDGGDPFGAFATCTAYRSVAGAYVVAVSDPGSEPTSVSIVSAGRIAGAGAVDADVRVERGAGASIAASGSMTLDEDLAGGTYLAFASDGARVEGSFDCRGSDGAPATMQDADVGVVEVVVLLDRDGSERVVTATLIGAEPSDCPAGDAPALIVRADGDDALGSITTFELDEGTDGGVMRMRVGSTVYEAEGVVVTLDDDSRSGTFAATTADGVDVAGAFACS